MSLGLRSGNNAVTYAEMLIRDTNETSMLDQSIRAMPSPMNECSTIRERCEITLSLCLLKTDASRPPRRT